MKPAVLLSLLSFLILSRADAQRIRFTDTTNRWKMIALTSDPSSNPAAARYGRDTVIGGRTYRRLAIYGAGTLDTLAVREDTLAGKIYFRFMNRSYARRPADTLERTMFDYNLSVGDTLKMVFPSATDFHIVTGLDSVRLGTGIYKHWTMRLSNGRNYEFIEGVGTNQTPVNIFYPIGLTPALFQLSCFSNRGMTPPCTPAIYVPFKGYTPRFPFEPIPVDSFDNSSSCTFRYVSVPPLQKPAEPVIAPNPGGREIVLTLPDGISGASLQITDVMGRNIAQVIISGATTNIGKYLSTPGVYYYTLRQSAGGWHYTGRLIFR